MGELPVLQLKDGRKLSQSGSILHFLARTHRRFLPVDEGQADEVLRWLLFDNHRFTAPFATLRYLVGLRGGQESPLTTHLRAQADSAYRVVDTHLASREFIVGSAPTIADISMAGYLYYDEETRFDRTIFTNIQRWAKRIAELPGWAHPYDLMPRAIRADQLMANAPAAGR
jgi:glutathione S-transferase